MIRVVAVRPGRLPRNASKYPNEQRRKYVRVNYCWAPAVSLNREPQSPQSKLNFLPQIQNEWPCLQAHNITTPPLVSQEELFFSPQPADSVDQFMLLLCPSSPYCSRFSSHIIKIDIFVSGKCQECKLRSAFICFKLINSPALWPGRGHWLPLLWQHCCHCTHMHAQPAIILYFGFDFHIALGHLWMNQCTNGQKRQAHLFLQPR